MTCLYRNWFIYTTSSAQGYENRCVPPDYLQWGYECTDSLVYDTPEQALLMGRLMVLLDSIELLEDRAAFLTPPVADQL